MKIAEVCLQTQDVVKLADFYKRLLHVENNCDDPIHQFILTEETTLAIYNDGVARSGNYRNICLSFTVADVDAEFERLKGMGVTIVSPPTLQPWGAKNMSFLDPDGNLIYFRSFPGQ